MRLMLKIEDREVTRTEQLQLLVPSALLSEDDVRARLSDAIREREWEPDHVHMQVERITSPLNFSESLLGKASCYWLAPAAA